MGDFEQAIEFYQKALDISLATNGREHPSSAAGYNNLGAAYDDKGDSAKAIESYNNALAIYVAALGANHPLTAIINVNIGVVHLRAGDKVEPERCCRSQTPLDS
eukprot:m.72681 g.72681  ORF g.72681 m.72681 type:complete len:104 (+) comp50242_c0_seq27:1725-2036(+)